MRLSASSILHIGRVSVVVVCALWLSACAKQPHVPVSPEIAALRSQLYEELTNKAEAQRAPYRINASLRIGQTDDTRRVSALLWSNGDLPVRLDLMAGMGPLVARIRQDEVSFAAFSPRENTAWITQTTPSTPAPRVLFNLGVPMPFDLSDLALLLQGRFSQLFGTTPGLEPREVPNAPENVRFTLANGTVYGEIDLDARGLPVYWNDPTTGWNMTLTYEEHAMAPKKVHVQHPEGHTAILLVKKREHLVQPFDDTNLALDIPAGTMMKAIQPATK